MKNTKPFLNNLIAVGWLAIGALSCNGPIENQNEKRKPNILFVSIDDLGPNLGAYDNKYIKSPNLDEFAEKIKKVK